MLKGPYSGPDCKLLLAFEVGTAYGGISYSILEPGKEPKIQAVRKFPCQFLDIGNTKIPPVVYSRRVESGSTRTSAVPFSDEVAEAQSNLLKYLNNCAQQHIQRARPGTGTTLWDEREIHYILSHPNEWEGPQQSLMRQAAEMAGLVKGGRNRLSFITQGEAILNLFFDGGPVDNSISRGDGVIIADAGEGTVSISAYASTAGDRAFEELARPQCYSEGSIFVTKAAGEYLYKLLKDSMFLEDLPRIKKWFEQTVQCTFNGPGDAHYIQFRPANNPPIQPVLAENEDTRVGINQGCLRLDGEHIASFFEPSIERIVDVVLSQRQISQKSISTVILAGSFSTSDYVFRCIRERLELYGLQVFRPHTQANDLVTNGAILNALKNYTRTPVVATIEDTQPPSHASPPATATTITAPSPPSPAPASAPSSRFDNLTSDNYHEWKIYMAAHLVREGLFGVVNGTESHPDETKKVKTFQDKKARARAELISHVSPSQLVHCSYDDPALIWNALATVHTAYRRATINSLRRQLHKLRLEDDETMSAFIGRARRLGFSIKEAGGDINDGDLIVSITAGLPSSYDSCISFLDTLPDLDYNLAAISAHLVAGSKRQSHSRPLDEEAK